VLVPRSASGRTHGPPSCRGGIEQSFRSVERLPNAYPVAVSHNNGVILLEEFELKTGGRLDALDITDEVSAVVGAAGIECGNVLVFSPHTTCCVLIATPGRAMTDALERAIRALAPDDGYYAHDDLDVRTENLTENEPANAPAHIAHAFLGKASESVPVVDGALVLGEGQRVLFVELDSSRERHYCVQVVGE
jgi:secondary thiamine-phosphate synthase enzyme